MKITVEFDSMEEFEAFRASAKRTRGKGAKDDVDDAPVVTMPATAAAPPVAPAPAAFAPPPTPAPSHGFPGANGASAPPAAMHPLATAILGKIDGAVASGQPHDAIVAWFRQQIGPDAANATLDQIKQVFIPRLPENILRQIAPQLGIAG